MRILIADDSKLVRDRLQSALSAIPNVSTVRMAGSAEEAATLFREFHPGLVILDVRISPGNGIATLKLIKAESPKTAVVMFSSYPEPHYRQICLKEGATDYLLKAGGFETLLQLVNRLALAASSAQPVQQP